MHDCFFLSFSLFILSFQITQRNNLIWKKLQNACYSPLFLPVTGAHTMKITQTTERSMYGSENPIDLKIIMLSIKKWHYPWLTAKQNSLHLQVLRVVIRDARGRERETEKVGVLFTTCTWVKRYATHVFLYCGDRNFMKAPTSLIKMTVNINVKMYLFIQTISVHSCYILQYGIWTADYYMLPKYNHLWSSSLSSLFAFIRAYKLPRVFFFFYTHTMNW